MEVRLLFANRYYFALVKIFRSNTQKKAGERTFYFTCGVA